jgi:MFS family permease
MTAPPRTAELILESLGASAQFRDPLLGDLAEGFARRVEREGVGRARRWYYREALRTAPHMLREGVGQLHTRDVKHVAGVVFAAYCLVLMLGFLVSMMAGAMLTAWEIAPLRFGRPDDPLFYVGYALGFACTVIGGVIAAWLDERTPLLSALALGGIWAALGVITSTALADGAAMGWLRVIAPLTTVTGATLGGVLRLRALKAPEQESTMPLSSGR